MATWPKIVLNEQETKLKDLLLEVASSIDESKTYKEKVVLRFAGGWVRDKLLHIGSHDIDIVINNMGGVTFTEKILEHLKGKGKLDKSRVNKIKVNPEKSKHLETATMKLLGLDVDFANLRKETYTEDSRNPQVEFGTPKEDAFRRDARINALFYNLNTDELEDFTGGLEDLRETIIQTPSDPLMTFMDDPLRVLRLIRFANNLRFCIDDDTMEAMRDPDVHEALEFKISRERIGTEVEKMLKGGPRGAMGALAHIQCAGLYNTIFTDPTLYDTPEPKNSNLVIAMQCYIEMAGEGEAVPNPLYTAFIRSKEDEYFACLLVALTPWSKEEREAIITGKGAGKKMLWGERVVREGLKADNKTCKIVHGAFKNFKAISEMRDEFINRSERSHVDRGRAGKRIQDWAAQGNGQWHLQVLFAIFVEAFHRETSDIQGILSGILSKWNVFLDTLEEENLMDVTSIKSPVDGSELSKALGVPPGRWMQAALNESIVWKLNNPNVKDKFVKKSVINHIRSMRKALQIPKSGHEEEPMESRKECKRRLMEEAAAEEEAEDDSEEESEEETEAQVVQGDAKRQKLDEEKPVEQTAEQVEAKIEEEIDQESRMEIDEPDDEIWEDAREDWVEVK